jgi:hypothetical protein
MSFIWHFGALQGIPKAAFQKRWEDPKNGYPSRHGAHFDRFAEWWESSYPTTTLCPAAICTGLLATHLTEQTAQGAHHDVLRDVSTSISMACIEASDQKHQPGNSYAVSNLFEGERRHKPTRRQGTGVYQDVAKLHEELMWRCGPSGAMTLGHKKERIVALLAADSAARPSDIAKLFRVFSGWKQQIDFTTWGVRVRFFYAKEIIPGSSRDNSTGCWFSTWVHVHKTLPSEISTPECPRGFLDSSSGPEFELEHIPEPELDCIVQPLARARLKQGKH